MSQFCIVVIMNENEWVSPQTLAEELGLTVATIYAWRHRGGGPPAYRIGRHLRYRRAEVEVWLASRRDHPEEGSHG